MTTRLEVAVKAWDHHWGDRYGDEALEEMGEEVQVALDAGDAVMFSEEAIKKAAQTICPAMDEADPLGWVCQPHAEQVREVIAALKEAS